MSESKEPPRLPDVVDEAAPSPRWLPWLGLGLLSAVALAIAAQVALDKRAAEATAAEPAPEGAVAVEGAAAEDPAAKPARAPVEPAH